MPITTSRAGDCRDQAHTIVTRTYRDYGIDQTQERDHHRRMVALSSALDTCAPLLQGELVLLDYPVHGNVGDLLIWMGEKEFLKRHRKTILGKYSINNTGNKAHRLIEKCTTICFQGGGNFGDLWPWHQKFREQIIQQYPHKRIVMLPQSVHFDDPQEMDKSCAILKRHPDLHILLRGKRSFALLQDQGLSNLMLCPDMAHALWGRLSAPESTLSSPLYLLRRDKEDSFLPPEIAAARAASADWDDLLTGTMRFAYRAGMRAVYIDGGRKANNLLPASMIWGAVSQMLVHRAIGLFAPHETIVTNRLHAVILSALLGRKAVAFDNSYGKISSYVDSWLSGIPTISMQRR